MDPSMDTTNRRAVRRYVRRKVRRKVRPFKHHSSEERSRSCDKTMNLCLNIYTGSDGYNDTEDVV